MRSTIKRLLVVACVASLVGCVLTGAHPQADQDNLILSLVLRRSYDDGGFTVVEPETSLSQHDAEATKKYIKQKIKIEDYDIGPLVDLLFERNRERVRLTLKSSPANGYLVDYDGSFKKYFEKGGGGWDKWYKENPNAHGSTQVSLPAYDSQNHIVLVYVGTQAFSRAGSGDVRAYRYVDGKLERLGQVMLWIS